jgi:hypothetical protein
VNILTERVLIYCWSTELECEVSSIENEAHRPIFECKDLRELECENEGNHDKEVASPQIAGIESETDVDI